MQIDLSLNEYGVDTKELAGITARHILSQLGLKVSPRDVMISDLDLFQSKIPEIIRDTRFTINDYNVPEDNNDDSIITDEIVTGDELSETDLTVRLFFSRSEYQGLEQAYVIQDITEDGHFIYSNGKTSEYDLTLITYIYRNLLEYYSSYYSVEDIQLDIQNNHGEVSLYVLSRILASIEEGVYSRFGFSCTHDNIEYTDSVINGLVLNEIRLLEEYWEGKAPLSVLAGNISEKYNIGYDKINNVLKKLLGKGLIYQPDKGHYKTI